MCAALYGLGKEARPACFFRARSQGGLFSNRREGITIKKEGKKRERNTTPKGKTVQEGWEWKMANSNERRRRSEQWPGGGGDKACNFLVFFLLLLLHPPFSS